VPMQTFRTMDPAEQRALAQKGGRKAHAMGTAHQWTREEARAAGRLGGLEVARRKREAKAARLAAEQST
jgi:uncharacterized protein